MLPPLYAGWVEELLSGPVPEETRATCHNCAMLPRESDGAPDVLHFHPATKCCTFVPLLPNFLVGRILADSDPAGASGRRSVLERLRAADGVSPLGLDVPRRYGFLYGHNGGFGRTPSMRCPHYLETEGGLCGVWKHRNSICSTWFCKHDRGAAASTALVFRLLGMTIGISTLTAAGVARLQSLTDKVAPIVQGPDESTAAFLSRQQQYIQDHAIPLSIQVMQETFLAAALLAALAIVPILAMRGRRAGV